MRPAPGLLAMAGLATLALASAARAGEGDDTRARKLMEEAFHRRYRWAEDFKGFSADFSCRREGRTVRGTVRADATKPHGGVEVTCDDEAVKELVQSTVASTVTHSRASRFDTAFGDCTFAIEGEGSRGGTKIKVTGHAFFKDFTVKDGHIIENHGGHGEMSSEVSVRQVVWMAESGKTLPREYAFRIKTGEREQTGTTVETWREVDGIWLPTGYRMTRAVGSAPVESELRLENIKVERGR
jgi:Protein of unknown function (DUF3386)